jgi:hypothetical protein
MAGMSLDDLSAAIDEQYSDLGEEMTVSLDRETRNELAMLSVAMEPDDPDELIRRAVHMLFQTQVDTGKLDFHLRSGYDVTYDEYLMDMTMDTYNQQQGFPQPKENDDRRYQF